MRYAIYTYRIGLFGFGVYIHRKEVLFGGRIDRKGRPERRAGPLLLPDGAQDVLSGPALALVAAKVAGIRLIDNAELHG